MEKHNVIFEMSGIKVTAQKTQKELTELLLMDGVKLISVNDTGASYYRPRKRKAERK